MAAWLTVAGLRARATVPAELDDTELGRALAWASDVLEGLSGVRPPSRSEVVEVGCGCGQLVTGPYPTRDVGAAGVSGRSPFYWRTGPDLVLADGSCGCELELPEPVVLAVDAVTVDGVLVPADAYELVNGSRLRRLSGPVWPAGRTRITYTSGAPLGEAALAAVAELALETAKGAKGLPCGLPARIASVTRQGITATAVDPQAFLDAGRTGLYRVDLFLTSSRQPPPRRRVAVLIPDAPRFEHRRLP